jgi:hypothetical protein
MARAIERPHALEVGVVNPDKMIATEQLRKRGVFALQVGDYNRLAMEILLLEQGEEWRRSFGIGDNSRHTDMADILAQKLNERGLAIGAVPERHKEHRPDKQYEREREDKDRY